MSSSKPYLLPPSSFEAPAAPSQNTDPWAVIQQTASEILALQETAKRLKDSRPESRASLLEHMPSDAPPRTSREPVTTTAVPVAIDFAAYDNIIRRQGITIEQLQSQLQQCELKYEKLIGQLKNEQIMKESQQEQRLADLTAENEALRKSHDVELRSLLEEKERMQAERIQLKTDWQRQLKAKEEAVEELDRKLGDAVSYSNEQQKQFSEEIRLKSQVIEDLRQQLNQLRTYLSESESISRSSDIWKKEIQELKCRLQLLENEKRCLITEKELVTTRFGALEDILRIQEQQIDQNSGSSTSSKKCLLSIWREKVFELMVQLKAVDLTAVDEKRNWNNKMSVLEKNCKDLENKCQVLSHVVREKQAALDLEGAVTKSVRIELAAVCQQLEKEKLEHSRSLTSLCSLKDQTVCAMNDFMNLESLIKQMDGSIKSLSNRISFASGRIELLQAQFSRKEALLKMDLMDRPEKDEGANASSQSNQELEDCRAELERVTAERNNLAAQISSDAQKLQERIQNATRKATEEACDLRQRVEDLHEELDKKSEKVEELNCLVEVSRQELAEAQSELQSQKFELEKTQIRWKSDMENKEAVLQEDFLRQLSETKRELTKAVVRVRQVERQMEREKERWTSQMTALVGQHEQEVELLREKLHTAEKDNNIFMATLRQEGLLSKARRQRSVPAELPCDTDDRSPLPSGDSDTRKHFISPAAGDGFRQFNLRSDDTENKRHVIGNAETNKYNTVDSYRKSSTPSDVLQTVAEDLKHLTSQVLNDEDEDNVTEETEQTVAYSHLDRTNAEQ